MPILPTYPGVYIEEIPSGVKTIIGVSTSVAAFIDYFKMGPANKAVQILNMGDFERIFGGLDPDSEASYSIQQFFLNGGNEAWVVRTASGNFTKANVEILSSIGGQPAFIVEAINEGTWGNNLLVSIDYNTLDPASLFNMLITEFISSGGSMRPGRTEVFRNLSIDPSNPSFVQAVVNDEDSGSNLVRITNVGTSLPLQNGTVTDDLSGFSESTLTESLPAANITIGTEGTSTAILQPKPKTLEEARSILEKAIRSSKPDNPAFSSTTVEMFQNRFRILSGPTTATSNIAISPTGDDPTTVKELKLDSSSIHFVKGIISGDLPSLNLTASSPSLNITIGSEGPYTAVLTPKPTSLADARDKLEAAIRAASATPAFKKARVAVYTAGSENRLIVIPRTSDVIYFAATPTDPTTLNELKLDAADVRSIEGVISSDLPSLNLTASSPSLNITIGSEGPYKAVLTSKPTNLADARDKLEAAIRAAPSASPAFKNARVAVYTTGSDNWLIVIAEKTGNVILFTPTSTDSNTAKELKLDTATANVREYELGAGAAISNTAQGPGALGSNGSPPDGTALIGDLASKTGIYALEDVDLFNILCIPRTAIVSGTNMLDATAAVSVIAVAIQYCEKRRAFFIMDTPNNIGEVQNIKNWLDKHSTLRSKNSALYFPHVKVADPLNGLRLRSFGASGTIAGLYARIDSNRGVWKAPAGTEATLVNVQALDYTLTDEQNGTLNPLAINCLRNFAIYGNVCWGSRTLDGADQIASEWKYVPVRRFTLYIEESLYRSTQWVVFEPNDEPLWAQIRLNIGAFMHTLFRQGAFQGKTPQEAYFVKCDKETTTQDDINKGIVNIVVGFAPLKPAEFVIIKIQQIAGQIQT